MPGTNCEFWKEKFRKTRARDHKSYRALRSMGWSHLVIWECQLRNIELLADRITEFLDTS